MLVAQSEQSGQEEDGARKEEAGEESGTRPGSSVLSWTWETTSRPFTGTVSVVVTGPQLSPATSRLLSTCFPAAPFRFNVL